MIVRALIVITAAIAILFTVESHARAAGMLIFSTTKEVPKIDIEGWNKNAKLNAFFSSSYPSQPNQGVRELKTECSYVVAQDNNPFSGATSIQVSMHRVSKFKPQRDFDVAGKSYRGTSVETCTASQYGIGDGYHGKRTASGAIFNTWATSPYTVAHLTRPFGSWVTVTNLANGRSIRAKVTDRGPYYHGRCVDLGRAGANAIGMGGTARVTVE